MIPFVSGSIEVLPSRNFKLSSPCPIHGLVEHKSHEPTCHDDLLSHNGKLERIKLVGGGGEGLSPILTVSPHSRTVFRNVSGFSPSYLLTFHTIELEY